MDPVSPSTVNNAVAIPKKAQSTADLGSGDFFKLLITQILNQDPFQPTSNEDLLKQIASIRDIELSTTLTESLQRLTGQQHSIAASSMIGQYVTSVPSEDGTVSRGIVLAVRFLDGGTPVLQLSGGEEIPLDKITRIEPPAQAAQGLIGLRVAGIDRRPGNENELIEGVVSGVRTESGEVILELESGENLRLQDVVAIEPVQAAAA